MSLVNLNAQFEYEFNCGFTPDTSNTEWLNSQQTYTDTTLKVGLLLVQFSDWQTNIDARGAVGWRDIHLAVPDTINDKYRYDDR